jgi:hypothetical protein
VLKTERTIVNGHYKKWRWGEGVADRAPFLFTDIIKYLSSVDKETLFHEALEEKKPQTSASGQNKTTPAPDT